MKPKAILRYAGNTMWNSTRHTFDICAHVSIDGKVCLAPSGYPQTVLIARQTKAASYEESAQERAKASYLRP
jgi:hypothetical protein